MSPSFTELTHNAISSGISDCVCSIKSAEDKFNELIGIKKLDGFKIKRAKQMIQDNKKSIERISSSFTKGYSDKKETLFAKSSVPVVLLYVAQKRVEHINRFLEETF